MYKKCISLIIALTMLATVLVAPGFATSMEPFGHSEIQTVDDIEETEEKAVEKDAVQEEAEDVAIIAFGIANASQNIKIKIPDWKIWPSEGLTTSVGSVGVSDADALNPDFSVAHWQNAEAPGSVLGSLVDDGYYDALFGGKDAYFDDNLYKVPVTDFDKPWWYRTTFTLPADQVGKRILLTFEGVNYSADIFVNGVELFNQNVNVPHEMLLNYDSDGNLGPNNGALDETGTGANSINYAWSTPDPAVQGAWTSQSRATMQNHKVSQAARESKYTDEFYDDYSKQFIGTYRTYELDITELVTAGENMINVKVQRPYMRRDLAWTWIDWHTMPADNIMGLIGNVFVSTSDTVRISNPFVSSKVSLDLKTADLRLYADLNEMAGAGDVAGRLTATIHRPNGTQLLQVSKDVTVPSGAYAKEYAFTSKEFPQLRVTDPELWWPYLYGDQPLYTIDWEFTIAGVVSGTEHQRFGIREVDAEITTSPISNTDMNAQMLQVYVNHKPVLLKGAGMSYIDLLWRNDETRARNAIDYAKYMGLNMLRDEGKFDRRMIDYMNEQGVVLMLGWGCCDRWQEPGRFNQGERFIAYEGLYNLLRFFRQHPAFISFANGSDQSPGITANGANGQAVQYGYFKAEANTRMFETATLVSSGASNASVVPNASSGMHMNSRYDYQPPKFDFKSTKGIFGFVSEGGGAGHSIPVIEAIKKVLPSDQMWPYNIGGNGEKQNFSRWNVHASRGRFSYYDWGNLMIDNRYGESETFEQYIMKAQILQYDAQRANQEAVSLHRYKNTSGHVVWMYNNPWPSFFWNMYDHSMNPHGSTYGARKGNQPVHIMYDEFTKDISVINSTQQTYENVIASLEIYDINGNVIGSLSQKINIREDSASAPVNNTRPGLISSGRGERRPVMVGLELDDDDKLVNKEYYYFGQIMEAYGVSTVWNGDTVLGALTAPLTSAYFYRMELRDSSGKPLAYNSYVLATKEDELNGTGDNFRPAIAQLADFTRLNTLPPVHLDMRVTSQTLGNVVTNTVTITNDITKNEGAIAYAVELKARIDKDNLVAPVFYDDNLFTLFPGETRVIDVVYDKNNANFDGTATIEYTCYNNVMNPNGNNTRIPDRPRADLALGKTGQGSSTQALAALLHTNNGTANRQFPLGTWFGGNATSNTLASGYNNPMQTTVIDGKTVSNLAGGCWANNATTDRDNPWYYADLGSVQKVDRINLRWSYAHRPDQVVIEISASDTAPAANSEDWKEVAVWNNPNGMSFSDIIFESTLQARFIRIKPTGHRGAVSALGVPGPRLGTALQSVPGGVNEWHGTAGLPAMTQFALISFEAYGFGQSVFLDIQDDVKVRVNDDVIYSGTDSVNDRLIWLDGNTVRLSFLSDGPGNFVVLRNGVDITDKLDIADNVILSDLSQDETISVAFTKTSMITSLRINSLSIATVARGGTYRFELNLNEGATGKSVVWTIADTTFGYVDHAGNVTIFDKTGNVRLTATDRFSGISHSITLRIAS